MDLINKATKIIDHNRGAVAGLAVLVASIALSGCSAFDGKVVSSQSGEIVSVDERRGEYIRTTNELKQKLQTSQADILAVSIESEGLDEAFEADIQAASIELEARNNLIGQLGGLVTSTAGVPWLLPLITIGTTALAGGVGVDNLRKDKVIKSSKAVE